MRTTIVNRWRPWSVRKKKKKWVRTKIVDSIYLCKCIIKNKLLESDTVGAKAAQEIKLANYISLVLVTQTSYMQLP